MRNGVAQAAVHPEVQRYTCAYNQACQSPRCIPMESSGSQQRRPRARAPPWGQGPRQRRRSSPARTTRGGAPAAPRPSSLPAWLKRGASRVQVLEELEREPGERAQAHHRPLGIERLDGRERVVGRVPERAVLLGLLVAVQVADLPVGRLEGDDRDAGLVEGRVVAEAVGREAGCVAGIGLLRVGDEIQARLRSRSGACAGGSGAASRRAPTSCRWRRRGCRACRRR